MSYLLAAWLGPVQTFIRAARRPRDLWLGSTALSEAAKAAARSLQRDGARLIFPAPAEPSALEPNSALNVANKLLAEVDSGADCAALAARARDAARDYWRALGEDALRAAAQRVEVDEPLFRSQIEDVIEWAAAWMARTDVYVADRHAVERLLTGRRMLRDFAPARSSAGVAKSSLDGARESVLRSQRRPASISQGEELDAIGLIKRLALGKRAFPSVSYIAARPWLEHARAEAPGKLQALVEDLRQLPELFQRVDDPLFPFEADLFYPGGLAQLRDEAALRGQALGRFDRSLSELIGAAGRPSPYVAVLLADGDHMGRLLAAMPDVNAHQRLSQAMATFAGHAGSIVKDSGGALVYSGGDDVLAFLPLDRCLKCAQQLQERFTHVLETGAPSLSVGIGIGHSLEPLSELIELARAAEHLAKEGEPGTAEAAKRNSLALLLRNRSGGELRFRKRWTDDPVGRLNDWMTLLASGAVPDHAAYDLRELATLYDGWADAPADIPRDLARLLRRKRGLGPPSPLLMERAAGVTSPAALSEFAAELLVARRFQSSLSGADQ